MIPAIDEDACFREVKTPTESICLHIARRKAEKVFAERPEAVIIAADQMAFFDGKFYGKGSQRGKSRSNPSPSFREKTHQLINGLYMKYGDQSFSRTTINKMSLRPLSLDQIKTYVKRDQPLHSAGCYYIDQTGFSLFEKNRK